MRAIPVTLDGRVKVATVRMTVAVEVEVMADADLDAAATAVLDAAGHAATEAVVAVDNCGWRLGRAVSDNPGRWR